MEKINVKSGILKSYGVVGLIILWLFSLLLYAYSIRIIDKVDCNPTTNPLYWFSIISLILCLLFLIKFTKHNYCIFLIYISATIISLTYVFISPYLKSGDFWVHARIIEGTLSEGTISSPANHEGYYYSVANSYNKTPGLHLLSSSFMLVFGTGNETLAITNTAKFLIPIISNFSILIVFLFIKEIINNNKAALYGALFFAFVPDRIYRVASCTPEALGHLLLALMIFILLRRSLDHKMRYPLLVVIIIALIIMHPLSSFISIVIILLFPFGKLLENKMNIREVLSYFILGGVGFFIIYSNPSFSNNPAVTSYLNSIYLIFILEHLIIFSLLIISITFLIYLIVSYISNKQFDFPKATLNKMIRTNKIFVIVFILTTLALISFYFYNHILDPDLKFSVFQLIIQRMDNIITFIFFSYGLYLVDRRALPLLPPVTIIFIILFIGYITTSSVLIPYRIYTLASLLIAPYVGMVIYNIVDTRFKKYITNKDQNNSTSIPKDRRDLRLKTLAGIVFICLIIFFAVSIRNIWWVQSYEDYPDSKEQIIESEYSASLWVNENNMKIASSLRYGILLDSYDRQGFFNLTNNKTRSEDKFLALSRIDITGVDIGTISKIGRLKDIDIDVMGVDRIYNNGKVYVYFIPQNVTVGQLVETQRQVGYEGVSD